MTYREPDPVRADHATREREAAAWIAAIEDARARRRRRSAPSWLTWLLVGGGPFAGATGATLIARGAGVTDASLFLLGGVLAGFAAGVVGAYRLATGRRGRVLGPR